MISKSKVTAVIVFSVLTGLVFSPAFAGRYRPTPGGANRWEYEREAMEPEEIVEVEEVEVVETLAEKESLVDSTYNRAAGTVYITGKTITETTNATGEALVGTAEAGGRTLGGAADASGKALGGAADSVTGTAGAAYRTVVVGEEPVEEVQIEAVAIEQPKEKNLFEASWDVLAGTAGAIGRTFEAAYLSVFPVKETEEDEPDEPEPEEPEERTHRFVPRYHGMVARRVRIRQR